MIALCDCPTLPVLHHHHLGRLTTPVWETIKASNELKLIEYQQQARPATPAEFCAWEFYEAGG